MTISKYITDFVFDDDCEKQQQDLCDTILEQNPDHVFLNIAWEAYTFSPNMLLVDEFLFNHGISATWVIHNWSENTTQWEQLKCSTVFIDLMLWRVYNEIIVKKTNPTNSKWNPDANRYLFLTGKPDKLQRIGLLHQLHTHKLLDNCDHSLFMSAGMYESSRSILPNLSTQEFDEFVKQYRRNLDGIEPDMQENSMHYGGIPYNPSIYSTSKFRLVSESNMNLTPPLISEKTYLTIVNKNPFVIAGDLNSCQYLRNLGFETFDHLFDIPTYDNIKCVDARLSCVVEHVKQWLAGNFNKTQVAEMVEHNYNRYVELGAKIKQDFENTTGVDINLAIYSRDTNHLAMSKGW